MGSSAFFRSTTNWPLVERTREYGWERPSPPCGEQMTCLSLLPSASKLPPKHGQGQIAHPSPPQPARLTPEGSQPGGAGEAALAIPVLANGTGTREGSCCQKELIQPELGEGICRTNVCIRTERLSGRIFSDALSSNLPPDLGGQKRHLYQDKFLGSISTLPQERRVRETLCPGFTSFDTSLT